MCVFYVCMLRVPTEITLHACCTQTEHCKHGNPQIRTLWTWAILNRLPPRVEKKLPVFNRTDKTNINIKKDRKQKHEQYRARAVSRNNGKNMNQRSTECSRFLSLLNFCDLVKSVTRAIRISQTFSKNRGVLFSFKKSTLFHRRGQ